MINTRSESSLADKEKHGIKNKQKQCIKHCYKLKLKII